MPPKGKKKSTPSSANQPPAKRRKRGQVQPPPSSLPPTEAIASGNASTTPTILNSGMVQHIVDQVMEKTTSMVSTAVADAFRSFGWAPPANTTPTTEPSGTGPPILGAPLDPISPTVPDLEEPQPGPSHLPRTLDLHHETDVLHATSAVLENLLKLENGISRPICIAEFGAADGGVSLELMETAIDNINRMSCDQREIIVVYEDQIFNDFNVLFQTVGATSSNNRNRRFLSDNVHVMASATSMYLKCLPTGSVDLAFSSMTNHWLSKKPCNIRGGVFQSDCDREELEAFRHQFQSDWTQFLSCRAKELRSGGYLVVISFVSDDRGRCNDHLGEDTYDVLCSIWKGFRQNGKISEEEFLHTTSVTYIPTQTELMQPFQADIGGSLSLVSCTQNYVEVIPGLPSDAGIEDKETFVNRSINCIKPWLYNILKSGLSTDRTDADKGRLLDEYFLMLRNILMQMTTFCPILYRTTCLIAKRT